MSLTNDVIHKQLCKLVGQEKELLVQILKYLSEIDRRRIWAEMAYPSLFVYCIKALGYSESQACRRIAAIRVIRELPEVKDKIASGDLTLATVNQAHTFLRRESKVRKFRSKRKKRFFNLSAERRKMKFQ